MPVLSPVNSQRTAGTATTSRQGGTRAAPGKGEKTPKGASPLLSSEGGIMLRESISPEDPEHFSLGVNFLKVYGLSPYQHLKAAAKKSKQKS